MVYGYSVLGSPVFIASVTEDLKRREERLNQAMPELNRISTGNAEHCLWMKKFMNRGSDIEHRAFLALWLSRFVFPITCSSIAQCVFPIAVHLARGTKIALAPAIELRPKRSWIKIGDTRFARWHKMMMRVDNVRRVLDSAKENFDARCLRISELVVLDYAEHYPPHRVAMQFGSDQDLPAWVVRAKETVSANLYVPSRFYEADVTTRYSEWWKQSVSHLQGASKGVLRPKRTFRIFKISQQKDIDAFVILGSPLKKAKKSVETLKEEEKVCDVSASAGLPLEKLPPSVIVQRKPNDFPIPPGFPSKSNLVEAEETNEEDDMTLAELLRSSKRHDAVGNGQLGDGEYLDKEVARIIDPSTALIEKITQNATVESGLETAKEDARGAQGCETDGNQYAAEIKELQLEYRVSRLERIS
ncbi:hypothetical protein ACOSQ4_030834 [Xanthoceras sorbifolium]